MPGVRYCFECGERLKRKRATLIGFSPLCRACAPVYRRTRLMMAAGLIIIAASVFVAGRLSAPRQTHYLIGAPINSADQQSQAAVSRSSATEQKPVGDTTERMCGASTKRGRPCRRMVKGGGRCWQHRDKPPAHPTANSK